MALYAKVHEMHNDVDELRIEKLMAELECYPQEWLLRVEVLNSLLDSHPAASSKVIQQLREIQSRTPESIKLIDLALALALPAS
jgi:hypothetical protein